MARLQVVKSEDGWNLPPIDRAEAGSEFGWLDRLFYGWRDGKVFSYDDWEARDLQEFLSKDYKGRQIDLALTLPQVSATNTISAAPKDHGEFELLGAYFDADNLGDGCDTPLDLLLDQMTTATVYKKAFWEVMWTRGTGDFDGKVVPGAYKWRPQTTVRAMREPKTAALLGWEQEPYYNGPDVARGIFPIQVDGPAALTFIHGSRVDPINGTSDAEIAYWAWKTKQKILFLWFQFLEGVALPRLAAFAPEQGAADTIAANMARLKSSGTIGIEDQSGNQLVRLQQLDLSGKGADQFQQAITWLDQAASGSVLAGFLDLTSNATSGNGPVGVHLSADASDFFLQSLEAKNRERERAVRRDIFAPFIRYNFGPGAAIPKISFEPLNAEDKTSQVTMLSELMRSRDPALVPDEFIGELATQVADYWGMDGKQIRKEFDAASTAFKAQQAQQSKMMATQQGQQVAGVAGAVNRAQQIVATKPGGRGSTIPGINGPQLPAAY